MCVPVRLGACCCGCCCCHMIHKQSRETLMVNTLEPDLGRSGAQASGQWPNWRSFAPLAPICLGRQKWSTRYIVRINIKVRHTISYYCYIARIRMHIYPTQSLICGSFYLRYVPGLPNERYLVRSLDWLFTRRAWPGLPGLAWSGAEWSERVCDACYNMDMDMDWTIAKPFCHLSLRVWVIGTIMRYNRRRYCCKSKHIVTLMTTKVAHITVFNRTNRTITNCVPRSQRDSRSFLVNRNR